MFRIRFREFVSDYRFWIILFFLLRLYGIMNPPLEIAHNWRQTTVTMVARNFYETDANILYPRIDIAGEKCGITGMEFPLFNYLIYLISLVFGYAHWYGRIINLLVSSVGIYYFGKTVSRFLGKEIALYAVLVLLSSIWFAYGRKIMPDTFSASLVMTGIGLGLPYLLDRAKLYYLLCSAILISAGILTKLPSGILAGVLLIPLFSKNVTVSRKITFLVAGIISLIPVVWWYFYWVPYLVKKFEFQHFYMGTGLVQGFWEIMGKPVATLANFYENAIKYSGFAFFVAGLYLVYRKKQKLIAAVFLFSLIPFVLFILVSGDNFPRHSYYIIPFVPVMALVAGYGISQVKMSGIRLLLVVLVCFEGIGNQIHDFRIKPEQKALLSIESSLDAAGAKEGLILINSGQYPTPMYFAHRKGWLATNAEISAPGFIQSKTDAGLHYVVILKKTYEKEMRIPLPVVFENDDFRIYKVLK